MPSNKQYPTAKTLKDLAKLYGDLNEEQRVRMLEDLGLFLDMASTGLNVAGPFENLFNIGFTWTDDGENTCTAVRVNTSTQSEDTTHEQE